jgi:hypothetical protein
MNRRRAFLAAVLLLAGSVAACNRSAPAAHLTLSSLDPVREAFNADSGKVRAIFLASPT